MFCSSGSSICTCLISSIEEEEEEEEDHVEVGKLYEEKQLVFSGISLRYLVVMCCDSEGFYLISGTWKL
jgi:hypothetical protein